MVMCETFRPNYSADRPLSLSPPFIHTHTHTYTHSLFLCISSTFRSDSIFRRLARANAAGNHLFGRGSRRRGDAFFGGFEEEKIDDGATRVVSDADRAFPFLSTRVVTSNLILPPNRCAPLTCQSRIRTSENGRQREREKGYDLSISVLDIKKKGRKKRCRPNAKCVTACYDTGRRFECKTARKLSGTTSWLIVNALIYGRARVTLHRYLYDARL